MSYSQAVNLPRRLPTYKSISAVKINLRPRECRKPRECHVNYDACPASSARYLAKIMCKRSPETGPPPSGQLNAGVRKEEGLARRPCRVRTQECGHLQFEAMRVHTPTINSVNMATYCKGCGHYILSVKYNRRLSSGVTASVVCAVIY